MVQSSPIHPRIALSVLHCSMPICLQQFSTVMPNRPPQSNRSPSSQKPNKRDFCVFQNITMHYFFYKLPRKHVLLQGSSNFCKVLQVSGQFKEAHLNTKCCKCVWHAWSDQTNVHPYSFHRCGNARPGWSSSCFKHSLDTRAKTPRVLIMKVPDI